MPPPVRPRPDRTIPARTPGSAPKVAATCVVASLLCALALVLDGLQSREGWSVADLHQRQTITVWIYGGAVVVLQLIAGGALFAWWRASRPA